MGTFIMLIKALYVVVCIALVVVVLMQEGKSGGLGALNGSGETYWGKNKSRSFEGKLETITKILATLFILISLVINMKW